MECKQSYITLVASMPGGCSRSSMSKLIYFKEKIKKELDSIKDEIGELRYNLYINMVDTCNNYDELREMAELELQIDFLKYTKEAIKDKLQQRDVNINDLRKVYYPYIEDEAPDLEEDEIEASIDDPDTLAAMAIFVSKRLQDEPEEERNKEHTIGERIGQDIEIELTEEEELEILTNQALREEEEIQEDYGDTDEDGNDIIIDYDTDDEDDDEDDTDNLIEDGEGYFDSSNLNEIEIEDDNDFFIEGEDIDNENNSEEDNTDSLDIEDDEDYFIDSSDDDTDENENGESSEGDNDSDIEIDMNEDDLFIETDDEYNADDDTNTDEIEIDMNEDDLFIETDEDDTNDEDGDTGEIEIDMNEDDLFIETDEDENNDTSDGEDDYFANGDDYFGSNDGENEDILDFGGSSNSLLNKTEPKLVTPYNIFQDKATQGIFSMAHRGIKEAAKLTSKAVEASKKVIDNNKAKK